MEVLELYCGIGGMHLALNESGVTYEVKASVDINTNANIVYKHNFPSTVLLNRNIENLTPKEITNLNVNAILMSPPCQPFTRNGLQGDILDNRSSSLLHLLDILPELNVKYILLENVKGFENSVMRNQLIESLHKSGFSYQEFLLNPFAFGIPNSRQRYYCLAKKSAEFTFETGPLMRNLPPNFKKIYAEPYRISEIIENDIDIENYRIPTNVLQKRLSILDICYPSSTRSCCFTKAYGRYLEGTGSVFCEENEEKVQSVMEHIKNLNTESKEFLKCVEKLRLRFFTPREICRLMGFPETFTFPESISKKQRYMLLGNSVNVKVVSELIKILVD